MAAKSAPKELGEERGYSAHRERQRLRILRAAEGLFSRAGIDGVSMLEITSAAGVQPSTLYQYFKSKEEIVWALAGEIVRGMRERMARVAGRGLAIDKVRALLELMAEELEERPEDVRFMAQFDVLYARDFSAESVKELIQGRGAEGFADFRKLVKEGIKDGSLRADLDADLSLHALMNAAIGTQRRLGSLGVKVEEEYGKRTGELFRESARLLIAGMRSSDLDLKAGEIKKGKRRKRS